MSVDDVIRHVGAEGRCMGDFVQDRVANDFSQLSSKLQFWKEHNHTLPPPPPHAVCSIDAHQIDLHPTNTGGLAMDLPSIGSPVVGVWGYDFRANALPAVELDNASGTNPRCARHCWLRHPISVEPQLRH
jgi:hypothetical protein